jgi:hypothetical protein
MRAFAGILAYLVIVIIAIVILAAELIKNKKRKLK